MRQFRLKMFWLPFFLTGAAWSATQFRIRESGIRYRVEPLFLTKQKFKSKELNSAKSVALEEGRWRIILDGPPSVAGEVATFDWSGDRTEGTPLSTLFTNIVWTPLWAKGVQQVIELECESGRQKILLPPRLDRFPYRKGCVLQYL